MKYLTALAVLLAVVIGGLWACQAYRDREYQNSHIFVDDAVYPADATELNLGGVVMAPSHYEQLQSQLPGCKILWDVPFQGGLVPSDTTELTVASLSEEDLAMLDYFPQLTVLHAQGCRDYARLQAFQAERPQCRVEYQIKIGEQEYPLDTASITVAPSEGEEFLQNLPYFPALKDVHFVEPAVAAEALLSLPGQYPEIAFTWEKTVLGTTLNQDVEALDFSGTPLTGVEELEEGLAYFPRLKQVDLCDCGLDNEVLAQYRNRVREQYKVVWAIYVGWFRIRTDETTFMPAREELYVNDGNMGDLRYCEDMICVDVGHKNVKNIDWIYGMPHLQFLILADTEVCDITPVGTLKELIYLEIFKCPGIQDYTPLLNCTALQDLNLAYTCGDVSVLAEMTWLNSLWANCCNATKEQKQLLRDSLPDTLLELDNGWHMGNGWRDRENYYIMRDLLGMPYYDWGSQRQEDLQSGKIKEEKQP